MTNRKANIPIASVEAPFGEDPPDVHCPICGQSTRRVCEEHDASAACAHLAFIYVDDVTAYEYMSPAFAQRVGSAAEGGSGAEKVGPQAKGDTLLAQLARAGYGNHLLVMRITSQGLSCGPVSLTTSYGFDYETLTAKS